MFDDTHALVLELAARRRASTASASTIPTGCAIPPATSSACAERAPEAWIVVEKILEPGERCPTTGRSTARPATSSRTSLGGLFVDPAGEEPLTELYRRASPASATILRGRRARAPSSGSCARSWTADLNRLTVAARRICERHRRYRDYTRRELARALLRELIACFPVYRTYVRDRGRRSEHRPTSATSATPSRRGQDAQPELDPMLLDFLGDLLLLRTRGRLEEAELVLRFQQLTGPVMAKGVEDTAFYATTGSSSLNEVGGDPGRFGTGVEDSTGTAPDGRGAGRRRMLATSTHDTKRSEDVRARIAPAVRDPRALGRGGARLGRAWQRASPPGRAARPQRRVPVLPDAGRRLAARARSRSGVHGEGGARGQGVHLLVPPTKPTRRRSGASSPASARREFLADLEQFVRPLIAPGRVDSLAQMLLKLTAPGVPDIYQGTELWDLSLVDPDNRRPVDYELRRRLLERARAARPGTGLGAGRRGPAQALADRPRARCSPSRPGGVRREGRLSCPPREWTGGGARGRIRSLRAGRDAGAAAGDRSRRRRAA